MCYICPNNQPRFIYMLRKYSFLYCMYFLLLGLTGCNGCNGLGRDGFKKDGADSTSIFERITEEKLAKFQPTERYERNGRSKAFQLRPLEEMRITAKAGAFEEDPDIQVSKVDPNTMQMLDDLTNEHVKDGHLIFAWDINAGMNSDSIIPGKFNVEIDLKKLGVPKNLWPDLRFYRTDASDIFEEVSILVDQNGMVHYAASQNTFLECVMVFAALGIPVAGIISTYPGIGMRAQAAWESAGYPSNWWKDLDCFTTHVNDPFGTFDVIFRASHTELGDEVKLLKLKHKMNRMMSTSQRLYAQAEQQYKEKHPGKTPTFDEDGVECSRYRMSVDSIYKELAAKDEDLKNAEEYVPQSIRDVINGVRLAMRFIQAEDGLGLKPLSNTFNVYVCDGVYTGESAAISLQVPLFTPFIAINNNKLVKKDENGKPYYDKSRGDYVMVTMTHELSHLYEYTYLNFSLVRDNEFMEALGAYSEHVFTAWLKKHGLIDYDPEDAYHTNLKTGLYANQSFKEALCWPLGLKYPNKINYPQGPHQVLDVDISDAGYMMGQLVQYLCEHVPDGDKVTFDHMMNTYANNKTFLQDMMDIFGIKTEHEFAKYYEGFCKEKMEEIVTRQKEYQGKVGKADVSNNYEAKFGRGGWDLPNSRFHSPSTCVMRLGGNYKDFYHHGTDRAYPFCAKSITLLNDEVRFTAEDKNKNRALVDKVTPYNIMAVPSPQVKNSHMLFTLLEGRDHHFTEDPYFLNASASKTPLEAHAVFITRPGIVNAQLGSDYYIDFVALYQPFSFPKVKGRSKDGTGLNIDTRDTPFETLTEHGYVTGMQMAVINHKTGKSKTFNVPLHLCGKTVKLDFAKMGITDPDDIDLSVRTRWYFKHPNGKIYHSPATDRVHYKKEKQREVQTEEKEKPKEVKPEEENTEKENTEEEGFKTNENEVVDEDQGELNKTVMLKMEEFIKSEGSNGIDQQWKPSNVRARFLVKDGKFQLDVPAHQVKKDNRDKGRIGGMLLYSLFDIPAYSVTGDVKILSGFKVLYRVENAKISVKPSPLHFSFQKEVYYPDETYTETTTYDCTPNNESVSFDIYRTSWDDLSITVPIDASIFKTRNNSLGKHSEREDTESNCRFTITATVE